MLDQLAAVGLHRQFGESREQFARRVHRSGTQLCSS